MLSELDTLTHRFIKIYVIKLSCFWTKVSDIDKGSKLFLEKFIERSQSIVKIKLKNFNTRINLNLGLKKLV